MESLQLKLYKETKDLYEKLREESDTKTADQFLASLLENYQNPRKITIPNPDNRITITRLEETYNQLQDENDRMQKKITELTAYAEELQQAVESAVLPADMITVRLDPFTRHLLDVCSEMETKRTGSEVTHGDILTMLFRYQVKDGPGDYLPRRWSNSELRRIHEEVKPNE